MTAEGAGPVSHVHHRGPAARAILGMVRAYQWLRAGRPSPAVAWGLRMDVLNPDAWAGLRPGAG